MPVFNAYKITLPSSNNGTIVPLSSSTIPSAQRLTSTAMATSYNVEEILEPPSGHFGRLRTLKDEIIIALHDACTLKVLREAMSEEAG